jgi:hypothetical protein
MPRRDRPAKPRSDELALARAWAAANRPRRFEGDSVEHHRAYVEPAQQWARESGDPDAAMVVGSIVRTRRRADYRAWLRDAGVSELAERMR